MCIIYAIIVLYGLFIYISLVSYSLFVYVSLKSVFEVGNDKAYYARRRVISSI